MRVLFLSMLLAVLIPVAAFAQTGAAKTDAKAAEVLKQARKALGGEDKLKALQSLTANGSRRFSMGQNTAEGEFEVDMILPDKILTSSGFSSPMGEITSIQALNGDKVWNDTIRPVGMGGPGGGGGGGRMVFMGGPGGGNNPQDREAGEARQKAELVRLTLGLLLVSPSSFPLEYTYAGEATAPDGKADVIDAKGPNNFEARLFFDQKSHQLLMLTYKGKDFRQMMRGGPGGGQGGGQGREGRGQGGGQGRPPGMLSREELEKLPPEERAKKEAEMKEMRDKRAAEMRERMAKLPDVEFQWNFSDYKSVNGINLPHRLTKATAGETNEEWEIKKYKINPQIKPDKFEKKEKEKNQS
ncbi:MAG TPA: hypothetical protein VFD58_33150 [Blastocatellia bacterium]|nr:hypothetical protein [Blastocatellia bacterium]